MSWTDERIESLKTLFADGLSAAQIAGELGGGLTRNSIIGKVHRLGLTRGNHPSSANTAPKPRHKPAPRRHSPFVRKPSALPPVIDTLSVDLPDDQIPLKQRRTLLELENCHCRWPLPGEPVEFFCGHPSVDVVGGISYCHHYGHAARAYQPNTRRIDNFVTWGETTPRRAGRARS